MITALISGNTTAGFKTTLNDGKDSLEVWWSYLTIEKRDSKYVILATYMLPTEKYATRYMEMLEAPTLERAIKDMENFLHGVKSKANVEGWKYKPTNQTMKVIVNNLKSATLADIKTNKA